MAALYKALMEAGRKHYIGNFGSYAYNTLRIESGIPAWGSDVSQVKSLVCKTKLNLSYSVSRQVKFPDSNVAILPNNKQ